MKSRPNGWERQRSVEADVHYYHAVLFAQFPLPLVPFLHLGECFFPAKSLYRPVVLLSLMLNGKFEFWDVNVDPLLS